MIANFIVPLLLLNTIETLAASSEAAPALLGGPSEKLFVKIEGTTAADLELFCSRNAAGIHCHPAQATLRIFCPIDGRQSPEVLKCPAETTCRSHRKFLVDDANAKADSAQCISLKDDSIDEFCEDKLSDSSGDDLATDEFASYSSDKQTLVKVVRQCNPFQGSRRQILDCILVRQKCGVKGSGAHDSCVDTLVILNRVKNCPGPNVCRKYEEELGGEMNMATCIAPLDSLCLDRFWSHFSRDFLVKSAGEIDKVLDISPVTKTVDFTFCDPFKANLQIRCRLEMNLFAVDRSIVSSVLPDFERDNLKNNIRRAFPDLYKELYTAQHYLSDTSGNGKYELKLRKKSVKVDLLTCPKPAVYLSDIRADDGTFDGELAVSGSICKQLSRTLSRCLPENSVDISSLDRRAPLPGDKNKLKKMKPDTYAGFCAGRSSPGQFCIPGWPEAGVLCPIGTIVECTRPAVNTPAWESDLNMSMERCVQKFGIIPKPNQSSSDSFRRSIIEDIYGNQVRYGWWAACRKELPSSSDLPLVDVVN